MKKLLLSLVLLASTVGASDFTFWSSQTFTGPYTDNIIAISPAIANTNNNAVKVVIEYEAGAAASCNCLIYAVIEEEVTAGVWAPVAAQHEAINTQLNAPTRILVLSPALNISPGTDEFIAVGNGVRVSPTSGVAPAKFRLKIFVEQFTGGDTLTSLTLSASGLTYDY